MVPHLKIEFVNDELDPEQDHHTAHGRRGRTPVGPLELRIAYKLYLSAQKDFEDAVQLDRNANA